MTSKHAPARQRAAGHLCRGFGADRRRSRQPHRLRRRRRQRHARPGAGTRPGRRPPLACATASFAGSDARQGHGRHRHRRPGRLLYARPARAARSPTCRRSARSTAPPSSTRRLAGALRDVGAGPDAPGTASSSSPATAATRPTPTTRTCSTRCNAATRRWSATPATPAKTCCSSIGHPQKIVDWGTSSVHDITVAGKAVLAHLQAAAATRSYYYGCSTGGHQALCRGAALSDRLRRRRRRRSGQQPRRPQRRVHEPVPRQPRDQRQHDADPDDGQGRGS